MVLNTQISYIRGYMYYYMVWSEYDRIRTWGVKYKALNKRKNSDKDAYHEHLTQMAKKYLTLFHLGIFLDSNVPLYKIRSQ